MKYLAIRIAVALLTFVIGVFVTAQVNRAAYVFWPDVDAQPKQHQHIHVDEQDKKPCVRIFVEKR
jgi:hypothetical protein